MKEVFDEPVPRSNATVEAHVRRVVMLRSRVSLVIALAFGALTVVTGIVLLTFGIADGDITDALALMLPLALFGGLAPALAVRWLLNRDVREARRLVRAGTAYRALIASHRRDMYGAIHLVDVVWREDRREPAAHFDLTDIDLDGSEEVVVLALPRSRSVVGIFANKGTFVGRRASTRDAH